jgi:uncharacterized membrane protein
VKVTWKGEALSLAMLGTMFVMGIVAWPTAPDRIPVHWGLSGTPDRFGGKFEGLLGPALIAAAIYAVLLAAPRIDPRGAHYEAFAGPYTIIRTAFVGLMLGIAIMVQLAMRGRAVNVNLVAPVAIGVLFLLLGNYLPKIKSNWFIGVRTPWTLSSEESWRRTHRLAGWLFALSGVAIVVTTLLSPQMSIPAIPVSAAVTAGVSIVYSYFVWKHDPMRSGG